MKIIETDIKLLKPYPKNAKNHPQTQIDNVAESIKQFGFQQPIVVDKNYEIIIGHCRYMAAMQLLLETVPVVIAESLTDEQVKKLRLIDNKTNESDWDFDFLSEEVNELDFEGFNIDWGFAPELNFDEEETEEKLVEKKLCRCPECGHINEAKAFKYYEDTK